MRRSRIERSDVGIGSRGFVRGSCCAAQAGRRCLAGDRAGRKPWFVKPSSERPIRPRAKSVGSSGGVERRRVESTSSEVLSVEASSFVTRRLPSRGAVGSELGRSGGRDPKGDSGRCGGDGASEVRPETDRFGLKKPGDHDWSAEAGRFAVNETLDRRALGLRSPSEPVAARDEGERR